MKRIILSSHRFQKNNSLRQKLIELLQGSADALSAVIITTASAEWKEKNKHAVESKQVLEDIGFKEVAFLDIEFENPKNLENYDVIYISGGNPFYLLYHLKKSGADKIISELAAKGIIIVGVSGGGVVLGPNIDIVNYFDKKLNIVKLKDLTGLGLTDIIIYPHYKSKVENEIKKSEAKFNCRIKRLNDNQAIVISDDKVEEVG